ncbi:MULTISPECIES: PGPGW domain-containing protein [Prauserella salsuginis group]|uniref:PGPGW domain-containing protein n=1 Tax=Prauserella salsuginis TaxID=387889 RepID=A0ABW6G4E1_9PSEU|nr:MULTISPECIES: PGPGW domain-containing protein [Prauserella salsuginis group]MCR3718170.1 putative transmembrane protein (PGPGW) [Prauserella flava]MCR3732740.1 putative transmembrane protein (PGPGW) [Prauserella salsuginis]
MGHRHPVTRVVLAVVGSVVLLIGLALLVLPGPGLLLVLAGLIALAAAFPALQRYIEPVRARAMQAAESSVATPLRIAGSVLAGLGLIGAGVVSGLVPQLPLAGWATGVSLIISGVVLLGLLYYSHRRVRSGSAYASGSRETR